MLSGSLQRELNIHKESETRGTLEPDCPAISSDAAGDTEQLDEAVNQCGMQHRATWGEWTHAWPIAFTWAKAWAHWQITE